MIQLAAVSRALGCDDAPDSDRQGDSNQREEDDQKNGKTSFRNGSRGLSYGRVRSGFARGTRSLNRLRRSSMR